MLALLIICLYYLFSTKNQKNSSKRITHAELQDLIRRANERIYEAQIQERLKLIQDAHESFIKAIPTISEINLNKLTELHNKGKISDSEFNECVNIFLDLRNSYGENVVK